MSNCITLIERMESPDGWGFNLIIRPIFSEETLSYEDDNEQQQGIDHIPYHGFSLYDDEGAVISDIQIREAYLLRDALNKLLDKFGCTKIASKIMSEE
jgi:hypothetical protein